MILRPLLKATIAQDYIVFGLRWLMLIAFALAIILTRGALETLTLERFGERYSDVLTAFTVGAVATVLLGGMVVIPALRPYTPFLIVPSDWLIAGVFMSASVNNPLLVAIIGGAIAVNALLRLGTAWGLTDAVGVLVIGVVLSLTQPNVTLAPLPLLERFAPALLALFLFSLIAFVWSNALDEDKTTKAIRLKARVDEATKRLENMRERAKAITEMATVLNSTLNHEKILDACMDIGRIAVRENPKQRLISFCLLVEDEDELAIATDRGLQALDRRKLFKGQAGVIAQSLSEGQTVIVHEGGEDDPELSELLAFSNIESVLCIPLRAGYVSYGVLIFASTSKHAFNEDHIDTLQTLGLQATIALQNAVLYSTLREEKERIIRIEENARKALVRDLHDIPTQTMSAVAMQISLIPRIAEQQPHKLREEVETIRSLALRAVEEIRHVMFALRPLSLESQGLGVALEQLAQKMQQTYKQPMSVQVDPNAEYNLTQEQQSALFYLIEEAANNARKYAQADQIQVRIGMEGQNVIARIRDNGKGFDVNAVGKDYEKRSSFGMVNMRERAELVGGTLDLQSAIGKGTTITVRVPVQVRGMITSTPSRKKLDRPSTGPLSPLS
jgi:signal transduction histidine kinase